MIVVVADDVTIAVAEMTDEVEVDMMTKVAENMVDEVTIVVVIDETVMAVDEIMVVAAEIEADRQDGIIVVMIAMTVEVIAVVARHVAGTDTKIAEGTTVDEETMADVIMMIDVALTRMITNKNVMMIVVVMTIADTVAMIVRVAMKIVAAVVMMVHDHTHDLITNTMIVEDTNKSGTIEDKKDHTHVHSRSVNRPDWFRLPLKK